MRSLDTLIRLQKWQLDEKRRQLADLRQMHADIAASIDRLDREIASEAVVAVSDPSMSGTYSVFAQAASDRRGRLEGSLREIEGQIVAVEQDISEVFGEMKKLEITKQNRELRDRTATARRAQAALDEIGGAMVQRQQAAAAEG